MLVYRYDFFSGNCYGPWTSPLDYINTMASSDEGNGGSPEDVDKNQGKSGGWVGANFFAFD